MVDYFHPDAKSVHALRFIEIEELTGPLTSPFFKIIICEDGAEPNIQKSGLDLSTELVSRLINSLGCSLEETPAQSHLAAVLKKIGNIFEFYLMINFPNGSLYICERGLSAESTLQKGLLSMTHQILSFEESGLPEKSGFSM